MTWQFSGYAGREDPALRTWQELNETACAANPVTDGRFMALALEHFGSGRELIATYRRNGDVLAAAILAPAGRAQWSLFQPSQLCMAPLIHRRDISLAGILNALVRDLPAFCLRLHMPKLDPMYQDFGELNGSPAWEGTEFGETFFISLEGDFDSYWQKRSRNLRQNARRWIRHLERDEISMRFAVCTRAEDMVGAVSLHGALESSGWKGDAGSAIRTDDRQGRFYTELLREFAREDLSLAYQLYFDEVPAASVLAIGAGQTVVVLKIAHRPAFRDYSPGRLIDYYSLEHMFNDGRFRIADMYTRASPSDLAWASETRTMVDGDLYRPAYVAKVAALVRGLKHRLGRAD